MSFSAKRTSNETGPSEVLDGETPNATGKPGSELAATRNEDNTAVIPPADDYPADQPKSAPADRAEAGPFDVSEASMVRPYIDLGAIKILPREGMQMRLEVDESSQRIVALTLEIAQSSLQIQAFSSARSSGLWHRLREQTLGQLGAQQVAVVEQEGPLGPELRATFAQDDRALRFIGVDGPRWFLRGVISGAATRDAAAEEIVYELFRSVVVVRGEQPMPPAELLSLQVPAAAVEAGTNRV